MRMFFAKLLKIIRNALFSETSPHKLALSCAIGIYISFCPFIGFHFLMVASFSWLLGLHFPLTLAAASLNNPWTMIPYYSSGYLFGHYLLHTVLGLQPSWAISLEKLFGSGHICVWSLLVGGNILGILCGVLVYPLARYILSTLRSREVTSH